jgi:hypothetical protein
MSQSGFRSVVSCVLLLLFPASMFAVDSNAAMLYTRGTAYVNGNHVPGSSAIFSGDLLQTPANALANINEPGSSITVFSDSLVRFDPASVNIEHGAVTVSTSKGVATTAGDVKITPASNSWTEFKVTDVDGTVRIAANKGDLTIFDGNTTTTLPQGQQTTRDENAQQPDENPGSGNDTSKKKSKNKKRATGATPAAGGGLLDSPIAIGIAGGAVGGLTAWVLIHNDNPASPSTP